MLATLMTYNTSKRMRFIFIKLYARTNIRLEMITSYAVHDGHHENSNNFVCIYNIIIIYYTMRTNDILTTLLLFHSTNSEL